MKTEDQLRAKPNQRVEGEAFSRPMGNDEDDHPGPCGIIIFGASGDLAKRKIIPALYNLYLSKLLPTNFFVLGTARTAMDDDHFRKDMQTMVRSAMPREYSARSWAAFKRMLYYLSIDYKNAADYRDLDELLLSLERKHGTGGNRIFYLALPPFVYETVVNRLGDTGLSKEEKRGYSHIVVEKPIGSDLQSAIELNALLGKSFRERQIYRMDHYLAKETVQNILVFRFANAIFEPIWNRTYIDHVEITVVEKPGIEHRAGYYEKTGVLRDMLQNHMFQLLALTAMEPPAHFETSRVRDEKVKVLRSIKPFPLDRLDDFLVLGQYGPGRVDGVDVPGYRQEQGVAEDSITPTYAAMKVFIDKWRWSGVPFYLRSGKRLSAHNAEISIHFQPIPHLLFSEVLDERVEPNTLCFRLQPDEGISLSFQAKKPGRKISLDTLAMDYSYQSPIELDAYERVLLDCMKGDHMLFARADGVEQAWRLLTPVIEKVERETGKESFPNYPAGTEGPDQAAGLLSRDGRAWRPL